MNIHMAKLYTRLQSYTPDSRGRFHIS